MKLKQTQSENCFPKSDRQKLVFRFSLLGLLVGGALVFFAIETARSDNQLTTQCLASYAHHVGQIPFDAMKECAID
jgi:fatty-acid desaturase